MNIVLSIPSGERADMLENVIYKWRKVCDFKIAVYTWDPETENRIRDKVDYLFTGELRSFAVNQNFIAKTITDWDVLICGADDLYPDFGLDKIETVCNMCPDKIIWVKDGFLNAQPTHPIITRGWYDKHGYIFNEAFHHNFCDTDLLARTYETNEIVKCFSIGFDHRHYYKTHRKPDKIYKLGEKTFAEDKQLFMELHRDKMINVNEVTEAALI